MLQLADYLRQLNALEWTGIGSITEAANGRFGLGKFQDALSWTSKDLESNARPGFSPQVTLESLEIGGPFGSFTSFSAAMNDHCVYVIENHTGCTWLRDLVPRLNALSHFLRYDHARVEELRLNDMKLVPMHPNLSFCKSPLVPPQKSSL